MENKPNPNHERTAVIVLSVALSLGLILLILSTVYAQTPSGGNPAPSDQCPDVTVSNIAGSGADVNVDKSIMLAKNNAISNCMAKLDDKKCKPANKCGKTGTQSGTVTTSKPVQVGNTYLTAAVADCTMICDPIV